MQNRLLVRAVLQRGSKRASGELSPVKTTLLKSFDGLEKVSRNTAKVLGRLEEDILSYQEKGLDTSKLQVAANKARKAATAFEAEIRKAIPRVKSASLQKVAIQLTLRSAYETLELPYGADLSQVEKSYRRLVSLYDDPSTKEDLKYVETAYARIKDSQDYNPDGSDITKADIAKKQEVLATGILTVLTLGAVAVVSLLDYLKGKKESTARNLINLQQAFDRVRRVPNLYATSFAKMHRIIADGSLQGMDEKTSKNLDRIYVRLFKLVSKNSKMAQAFEETYKEILELRFQASKMGLT